MRRASAAYVFVDEQSALEGAVSAMASAARIGVDTEADSRHRYPEKVCLVQLSDGARTYLVDTLAGLEYAPLGRLLADGRTEKVLHGADFDIRGLDRDFGFRFVRCYDTAIAARLAGFERLGLTALLEDLLGIGISKDRRLQRADWSRRPLEREAMEYASADVAHLAALRDALDGRLRALGRDGWAAEEFARLAETRYAAPDPETAYLATKGAHRLDGRGRAVLRALFAFREAEARRLNRPPGYVIPARALVFLAAHPGTDLSAAPELSIGAVRRYGAGIARAVRAGLRADPVARPRPPQPFRPRPTAAQSARLSRLKEWRAARGVELAVDPSVLWSMRSLERLAREPETFEREMASPEVRRWQRERFGGSLRACLEEG